MNHSRKDKNLFNGRIQVLKVNLQESATFALKLHGVIQLLDRTFEPFIGTNELDNRLVGLAEELKNFYQHKQVKVLVVLNGAAVFAVDLLRLLPVNFQMDFVKVKSYENMDSTGEVKAVFGMNHAIEGEEVLLLEDIVDTGLTIDRLKEDLQRLNPSRMEVCSLLFKPEAFKGKEIPKFIGFSIPNKFVVGYGLDYNEYGRNLKEIYQLKEL